MILAALFLLVLLLVALSIWFVTGRLRLWRQDKELLENPAIQSPLIEDLTALQMKLEYARDQLQELESWAGSERPTPDLEFQLAIQRGRIADIERRIAMMQHWLEEGLGG